MVGFRVKWLDRSCAGFHVMLDDMQAIEFVDRSRQLWRRHISFRCVMVDALNDQFEVFHLDVVGLAQVCECRDEVFGMRRC